MAEASLPRVTLTIPDMSCAHCVQTVSGALEPLDGVAEVSVDLPGKTATVSYDPARVTLEQMREVLADEDYPVSAVREAS
jgi:copper chaperone CopZ